MKKTLIICGSIYFTIISVILIGRFFDVYGLLVGILSLLVIVFALVIYELVQLNSISKIIGRLADTTDYLEVIKDADNMMKHPLTTTEIFLLKETKAYALIFSNQIVSAKRFIQDVEYPSKKSLKLRSMIVKLAFQLEIAQYEDNEKDYFDAMNQMLKIEKDKKSLVLLNYDKTVMTYYFQLLSDFNQPSLEKKVEKIFKIEEELQKKDGSVYLFSILFNEYVKLLALKVNQMPLNGIEELEMRVKGTYLEEKVENLKK